MDVENSGRILIRVKVALLHPSGVWPLADETRELTVRQKPTRTSNIEESAFILRLHCVLHSQGRRHDIMDGQHGKNSFNRTWFDQALGELVQDPLNNAESFEEGGAFHPPAPVCNLSLFFIEGII